MGFSQCSRTSPFALILRDISDNKDTYGEGERCRVESLASPSPWPVITASHDEKKEKLGKKAGADDEDKEPSIGIFLFLFSSKEEENTKSNGELGAAFLCVSAFRLEVDARCETSCYRVADCDAVEEL